MPDASTPDRLDALAVRSDHEGDHELALLLSDAAALASLGPEALRAAHARLAPLLPTHRPDRRTAPHPGGPAMTAPDWLDPLLSAVAWDAPDGVDGLVTVHGPTGVVCCSLMRADGRKVVVQVSGLAAPDTARALLDAAADWLLALPPAAPPVDLGDAARAFAEAVAHFAPRGR